MLSIKSGYSHGKTELNLRGMTSYNFAVQNVSHETTPIINSKSENITAEKSKGKFNVSRGTNQITNVSDME